MHHVIIAAHCCPNQPFAGESRVDDRIGRVPFLSRLRKLAVAAAVTKREDYAWQIARGMNFVEARRTLQGFTILCRKLRHIAPAQALNRNGKKQVKPNMFHAGRTS